MTLEEFLRKPRTLEEIADALDCTERSAYRWINRLEAEGFEVWRRKGKYILLDTKLTRKVKSKT